MFVVLLCVWTHAKMPWWQFWWDLCLSDFPVTLAIPTTIPTVIPTTVLSPSLSTTSLIPLSIAFSPLFHFFFWCWLQTFPIHSSRDLRSTEIVPRDPFLLFVEILNLDTVFEEAAKFILLLVLLSVFFVCVAWVFFSSVLLELLITLFSGMTWYPMDMQHSYTGKNVWKIHQREQQSTSFVAQCAGL